MNTKRFVPWVRLAAFFLAILTGNLARAQALVIEGKEGWLFPIWENHIFVNKSQIDAHIAAIVFLKDLMASHGSELLVMVVPMKASFYLDRLPATSPVSSAVRQRYPLVLSSLQTNGILTFDSATSLHAIETGKTLAFFRTDYHWTAQGAEASADVAADLIRQKVRFDTPPSLGSQLGEWVNVRRYGDLATRFMTSEQRIKLGKDVFTIRAPPTEKQSLLDEDPAQVHIVGNSFVQPYLGFPQRLSHTLMRPVSLTWKPGNVGPWVTMLSYLESDEYRQNKPRVLIWQLNEARMESGPDAIGAWDAESIMSYDQWRIRVKAATGQK
jgi:alginate O-acetyltransferase complex protein AlgJ